MSVYTPPSPGMSKRGPMGVPRSMGNQILLFIVTFGLYGIYWGYRNHEEIQQHTGEGVGGLIGALLWLFAFPVTAFLLPMEIQKMYQRDGRTSPVSASTAWWVLALGVPWYVKCQKALNAYWAS